MKKRWIVFSAAASVLFAFLIGVLWVREYKCYKANEDELVDDQAVADYLSTCGIDMENVPTSEIGVYILSLKFASSNDVEITGYV